MGGVSGQTGMPGAGEEEPLSPGLLQMISGPANPPPQESRAFELALACLPALLTRSPGPTCYPQEWVCFLSEFFPFPLDSAF